MDNFSENVSHAVSGTYGHQKPAVVCYLTLNFNRRYQVSSGSPCGRAPAVWIPLPGSLWGPMKHVWAFFVFPGSVQIPKYSAAKCPVCVLFRFLFHR